MSVKQQLLIGAIGLVALATAGCERGEHTDDTGENRRTAENYCAKILGPKDLLPPTDMSPSVCAAAKGLSGDTLLCIDFNQITSLGDSKLAGWNFDKFDLNCWEIVTNSQNVSQLQAKGFDIYKGTCGFSLPILNLKDGAILKYKTLTLSVMQQVDVSPVTSPMQTAQILYGEAASMPLIDQATGKQWRKKSIYTLSGDDLSSALSASGGIQPLFKLTSGGNSAGSSFKGWQFESIAVLGSNQ